MKSYIEESLKLIESDEMKDYLRGVLVKGDYLQEKPEQNKWWVNLIGIWMSFYLCYV